MAARLEWNGNAVQMGPFVLGFTESMSGRHRFVVRNGRQDKPSDAYESLVDCMQDCESEVRRLLKEAGCEVEP